MTNVTRPDEPATDTRVVVVGSGFAGLGAAIMLKKAGFHQLRILERADEIGGVWRDNDYPGAACDVQSYLYSYSFAPNPGWGHMFSSQADILAYLQKVVRDHDLDEILQLGCGVESATWDGPRGVWHLETSTGPVEAEHLVVATGALSEPVVPDLPGIESFTGPTFHSSRWDHDVDLADAKVAVIGTGASAIQFVPAIQPVVERLTLFQRTAPWVMPRHDRPIGTRERSALAAVPGLHLLQRTRIYVERELTVLAFRNPVLMKVAERTGRKHLREQISDPELRAKLTPRYRLGCKRILISNDYLPALDADNADVVSTGIREVTPRGVVDGDGILHEVDVIIYGTGFKTDGLPLTDRIHDAAGTTLARQWGDSPRAYMGTMVAGFPNLYLMHGPNIGLGHTSVITMFEAQGRYVVDAVRLASRTGSSIEPTSQAQDRFVEEVDELTDGTVWTTGGCSSWYLDATGRNSNLWPGATFDFHHRARRFRAQDHVVRTAETAGVNR